MALFATIEESTANAPVTWLVEKVAAGCWHLTTADGGVLDTFKTKKAAEAATETGFLVDLYEKEARWYAGETVTGWKTYAAVTA